MAMQPYDVSVKYLGPQSSHGYWWRCPFKNRSDVSSQSVAWQELEIV